MRYFAKPSGLERLSLEARIVYTAFCVFMLVGYASSAWLYADDELGTSAASAHRYYLGDEPEPAAEPAERTTPAARTSPGGTSARAEQPAAEAGPALELPADLPTDAPAAAAPQPAAREGAAPSSAASMRFAKAPRQVMETFHFHLFSVPVCLLIVAHIFMMAGWPTRVKAWVIGVGSLATLLHVSMPPLIRLASPAFAPLMFPSAALMGLTWLIMTVWPVIEMWRTPPPRPREARLGQGD